MRPFRLRVFLTLLLLVGATGTANAQELRYSWLDMSFMYQDVSQQGTLNPLPEQTVEIDTTDGAGIRFRGSLGTWYGFYLMVDYGSTDINLTGSVTNTVTGVSLTFADEFDYTTIRGGIGLKYSIFHKTDIIGEVTYDSLDFDFGSFAGENFDMGRTDFGATLGFRTLLGDHFELRAHGRYSDIANVDLTTGILDPDTLFGVGFSWEVIRGLAIVGDFESGELSSWSVGFRLDLDED